MACTQGTEYLLDPAGNTAYCLAPGYVETVEVSGFSDLASELLYVIERTPVYISVAGFVMGLAFLFLAAYAVKGLMS